MVVIHHSKVKQSQLVEEAVEHLARPEIQVALGEGAEEIPELHLAEQALLDKVTQAVVRTVMHVLLLEAEAEQDRLVLLVHTIVIT
jgi:hypothetical protein